MANNAFMAAQHFMRTAIIGKKHTDQTNASDLPKPKAKRKPRAKVTGQKITRKQVNG